MRLSRVFVEGPLAVGEPCEIRGTAAAHVARVLRLRPGDPLVLFDGRGGEHAARIETLHKDVVVAAVTAYAPVERESPLELTLAQGISRGERMDWVVQKATELGVRRIVPLLTERSVVRLDEEQAERKRRHWRAVAIAACEQCGRNRVPEIETPRTLGEALASLAAGALPLLLSPTGGLRLSALPPRDSPVTVLIGPEGGLSPAEQAAAAAAGFQALSLGPRILRTETAAVAAIAAIQQRLGDL